VKGFKSAMSDGETEKRPSRSSKDKDADFDPERRGAGSEVKAPPKTNA